jgi:hypothetical protein
VINPPEFTNYAVIYDNQGNSFVFGIPAPGGGATNLVSSTGWAAPAELTYSSGKVSAIKASARATEGGNMLYVRAWIFDPWVTHGSMTGPSYIREWVATTDMTTWSCCYSGWALYRTTEFVYFTGTEGYADATPGDLVAIYTQTKLSDPTELSTSRTFFRYHMGDDLDKGAAHQPRAVIGPTPPRLRDHRSFSDIMTVDLDYLRRRR